LSPKSNAKNIGNFTTLLEPHNIGTHLKGIATSFQVVPLFLISFHVWVSYVTFFNFLKIHVPSVLKGLKNHEEFRRPKIILQVIKLHYFQILLCRITRESICVKYSKMPWLLVSVFSINALTRDKMFKNSF
jgi:hypothetical protein